MKVIIMGCGRVGAALAGHLSAARHDVCVVDRDAAPRTELSTTYAGRYVTGNGYNRDVLRSAGIEDADAFVAVTSGDNTNIVAARVASEEFKVPLVIARIYDPRRADIYRDLGITTVASVRWTVDRIHQMLFHRNLAPDGSFGNGETLLVRERVPAWLAGRPLHELEADREIRAVEVTRGGRSTLAAHDTVLRAGDEVSFAVTATSLHRLRGFLDKELGT